MQATLPHGLKAWPVLWGGAPTATQDGGEMSKECLIKNAADEDFYEIGYEIFDTTRV